MALRNKLLDKYSDKSGKRDLSSPLLSSGLSSSSSLLSNETGLGSLKRSPSLTTSQNKQLKTTLGKSLTGLSFQSFKTPTLFGTPGHPNVSSPLFPTTGKVEDTVLDDVHVDMVEDDFQESLDNKLDIQDQIPMSSITNDYHLNNFFEIKPTAIVTLTEEQILKQDFINTTASSLVHVPKLDRQDDLTRIAIMDLTEKVIMYDPEFVLKTALFTRRQLNIRITANFLLALAAYHKACRPFIKKYFKHNIVLPSDWIDVAELYTTLPDQKLGLGALPVALRKVMTNKFVDFDEYQIGKYNKAPKKKKKNEDSKEDHEEDKEEEKTLERQSFSLKQLIRKLHISQPPNHVMPLLGKKYPETQQSFFRSRLPGNWDETLAGKRMKIPTPYTWETQLAAKGNNAETWKELILSRKLPYMAMLRNLRNIILAGVGEPIHKKVQRKISSPEDVKRSKQFPFRFLSAYAVLDELKSEAPANIKWASKLENIKEDVLTQYKTCLDKAVQISAIHNVQPIKGSLLILFDCSDGMDEMCSAKGLGIKRTLREVASLMTLMLMFSSEHCEILFYNEEGSMCGKKIETEGEILKHLLTCVDISKTMNSDIKKGKKANSTSKVHEHVTLLAESGTHYDNIIQISLDECPIAMRETTITCYREKVNKNLLYVYINLCSQGGPDNKKHRQMHMNDVILGGFSDQMLQYIAERGSGHLLANVETIDKKFNLLPLPKPMATHIVSPTSLQVNSRVIRVFVSSTFVDLVSERRSMMSVIIPVLNRAVKEYNVMIQEVDLRWGVTLEESSSNKVILRCLEEVERCDYFFCIVGDRFGTKFEEYPNTEDPRFTWLNQYPTGASMTKLEVNHALFHSELEASKNMFMIKSNEDNREAHTKSLVRMIKDFEKQKKNAGQNRPSIDHYIEQRGGIHSFQTVASKVLEHRVTTDLKNKIELHENEELLHESFAEKMSECFAGRDQLLNNLILNIKKGGMVMVTGGSGTGKTALLSRAMESLKNSTNFYHFVNAFPASHNLHNLLHRLCVHLSKVNAEQLLPAFDPISTLHNLLNNCEAAFTIVIDGCEEILPTPELFSWLPESFPKNVTVVFTTSSSSNWYNFLGKKYSVLRTVTVPKLSATEKNQVTKAILQSYGKRLEEKGFNSQLSMLLSKQEATNPLYIELCVNELRLNAVFETLTSSIKELPQSIEELYVKTFLRCNKQFWFCNKIVSYLYCSPAGIQEKDLIVFLQIKPLALSNLLHNLDLLIIRDKMSGFLSLSNQYCRKIVLKMCFNSTAEKVERVHKELGDLYTDIVDFSTEAENVPSTCRMPSFISSRKDAYQKILYHFTAAGDWKTLERFLLNQNFLRQIIYLGLIDDMIDFFNIDITKMKQSSRNGYKNILANDLVQELYQFLINNKNILSREPYLLKQRMLLQKDGSSLKWDSNSKLSLNSSIGCFEYLQKTESSAVTVMNEYSSNEITCLASSQQSDIICVGFKDGKLQVFNTTSSAILQTYRGHTGPITACGFLTTTRFVSGGSDGCLKLWGMTDSVCLASISPHIYPVQDIVINNITKCVLSAGIDRRVVVWHNDIIFDTVPFEQPISSVAFTNGGKHFVAGSWSGEMYGYDLVNKRLIVIKDTPHPVSIRAVASGTKQFTVLDILSSVSIWDQETYNVLKVLTINNIVSMTYDHQDNLIYGLKSGIIRISSGLGAAQKIEAEDSSPITCVTVLNAKTNDMVVGYYSGKVVYHSSLHSGPNKQMASHKSKVNDICYIKKTNEGPMIATCSDDGTVNVMLGGKQVAPITSHLGKVLSLAGSPSGILFSGGTDCSICCTLVTSAEMKCTKLYGHEQAVSTLCYIDGPETANLISGSHDGSVKLWRVNDGKCLFTATNCHTDWVTSSAACTSNSQFVTGSNDNTVILWQLKPNAINKTKVLYGHSSPVLSVGMIEKTGSEVDMIMAGAQDGGVVLWDAWGRFISRIEPSKGSSINTVSFIPRVKNGEPAALVGTHGGELMYIRPSVLNNIASINNHTDAVSSIKALDESCVASISLDSTIQVTRWSKQSAKHTNLETILDIQWCETADLGFKISALDVAGTTCHWSLSEGEVTLQYQESGVLEQASALVPPNEDNYGFLATAPTDNQENTVMKVRWTNSTTPVRLHVKGDRTWIDVPGNKDILATKVMSNTTFFDLGRGPGGQLSHVMMGTMGGDVYRRPLKGLYTGKPVASHNGWVTAMSLDAEYTGAVDGQIRYAGSGRYGKNKYFNSAVTCLELVGQFLFAASKDGTLKVLRKEQGRLKVMGMYHCNGPVTSMRALRHPKMLSVVYIVAGDKCGSVHFLKWLPPNDETVECPEAEVESSSEEDSSDIMMANLFD